MMCFLLPALLAPSNVKILAPNPIWCVRRSGFGTPSRMLGYPVQFKPIKTLWVGGRHSQRLNYHYQFFFSPFEPSTYRPSPEIKEPNIIQGVSPDGVKAHMSLMEKTPDLFVPIHYDDERKVVVFDQHRSSIVEWYSDRLLAFQGEDKDWLKYIAGAAWWVMGYIFDCLRYSVSSGVSFSSKGHFLNHMMIGYGEDGLLFFPFVLASSQEWKLDLQITSNFLYVVYNKRPLEEMKNLGSVTADHWLDTTPSFLKRLYHFLPTFDPNKHCAQVMLSPPYFWTNHDVLDLVKRLYGYIWELSPSNNRFSNRPELSWLAERFPATVKGELIRPGYHAILEHHITKIGFSWMDKLPEKCTVIRDLFDEFGGCATYKSNIDILKFYQDILDWDEYRPRGRMYEEGVFMRLDAHFGLLWVLYRLCTEYFLGHENMTGDESDSKEYLLYHLGFTKPRWETEP